MVTADYRKFHSSVYRTEMDPKEKLVLQIREDVGTSPIEVNVQSAGVLEEEQVFFTEEDNETEEQFWERKKQSKTGLKVPDTVIQIDAISEDSVDEITNFTQKLCRTNQIFLEQSKDPNLLQLKAKKSERRVFWRNYSSRHSVQELP